MIKIGTKPLTANDFHKILYKGEKVELDAAALKKVVQSHEFLKKFSKDKLIYESIRDLVLWHNTRSAKKIRSIFSKILSEAILPEQETDCRIFR